MWYFLEGYTDSLTRLTRAGLIAMEASIAVPKEARGIAFSEDSRERVLEMLDLRDRTWNETATDVAGMRYLRPATKREGDTEPGKLTVYMQDHECSRSYRATLVKLAEEFGISIKCFIPHGNAAPPEGKDGTLHVYVWSTPDGTSKVHVPAVYGQRLPGGVSDGCTPTRKGTVIRDPAGNAVAQAMPWNVYILFDLTHTEGYQDLFERIIRDSLPAALPHGWNERIKDRLAEQLKRAAAAEVEKQAEFKRNLENARKQYVAVCTNRLHNAAAEKRKLVVANEKRLDELTQQLISASRDLDVLRAELSGLEAGSKAPEEKIAAEFDQLAQHPDIERIEVEGRVIKVFTGEITIQHGGMKYNVGKYEIRISTEGSIRFYSPRYAHRTDIAIHPHIYQEGNVCWGMLEREVPKLLQRQEYGVLINMLINFLQGYNPAHSFSHISNWRGVPA